jgi:hypothetical protein
MANATVISVDEMYLKKDQAKKPAKEFEKLSQQDLEDICNEIVDGGSSSALGNHILEKEVDFMRDIVILMHVNSPEFRGKNHCHNFNNFQSLLIFLSNLITLTTFLNKPCSNLNQRHGEPQPKRHHV